MSKSTKFQTLLNVLLFSSMCGCAEEPPEEKQGIVIAEIYSGQAPSSAQVKPPPLWLTNEGPLLVAGSRNGGQETLFRVGLDGSIEELASVAIVNMVLGGDMLYLTQSECSLGCCYVGCGKLYQMPIDGSAAPTAIAGSSCACGAHIGDAGPYGLVFDASKTILFFTQGLWQGELLKSVELQTGAVKSWGFNGTPIMLSPNGESLLVCEENCAQSPGTWSAGGMQLSTLEPASDTLTRFPRFDTAEQVNWLKVLRKEHNDLGLQLTEYEMLNQHSTVLFQFEDDWYHEIRAWHEAGERWVEVREKCFDMQCKGSFWETEEYCSCKFWVSDLHLIERTNQGIVDTSVAVYHNKRPLNVNLSPEGDRLLVVTLDSIFLTDL